MSDCPYVEIADRLYRCPRCGHQTRRKYDKPPKRNCTQLGLGDRVERGLWKCGITKQRVTLALVYLRLKKHGNPCGCSDRQQKLNRIGDGVLSWWRSVVLDGRAWPLCFRPVKAGLRTFGAAKVQVSNVLKVGKFL